MTMDRTNSASASALNCGGGSTRNGDEWRRRLTRERAICHCRPRTSKTFSRRQIVTSDNGRITPEPDPPPKPDRPYEYATTADLTAELHRRHVLFAWVGLDHAAAIEHDYTGSPMTRQLVVYLLRAIDDDPLMAMPGDEVEELAADEDEEDDG